MRSTLCALRFLISVRAVLMPRHATSACSALPSPVHAHSPPMQIVVITTIRLSIFMVAWQKNENVEKIYMYMYVYMYVCMYVDAEIFVR